MLNFFYYFIFIKYILENFKFFIYVTISPGPLTMGYPTPQDKKEKPSHITLSLSFSAILRRWPRFRGFLYYKSRIFLLKLTHLRHSSALNKTHSLFHSPVKIFFLNILPNCEIQNKAQVTHLVFSYRNVSHSFWLNFSND